MNNTSTVLSSWKYMLITVLFAGLLGLLSYVSLMSYIGYQSVYAQLQSSVTTLGSGPLIRYGTVVANDMQAGTVTIRALDPSATKLQTEDFKVNVTAATIILREDLSVGADGVVQGVSQIARGSPVDIVEGTRVRAYLTVSAGNSIQAQALVFGSPI